MQNFYNRFDSSNKIHPTAIIDDCVKMGKNNIIGPYTVIGSNGEIRGVKNFYGTVEIGDGNIISEHVTIHRPAIEGQKTIIGNNNFIMVHAHIGHDAKIANNCEICSGAILGGYSEVGDNSLVKLGAILRNRKKIGKNSMAALGAAVIADVPDNIIVAGVPAKFFKEKK